MLLNKSGNILKANEQFICHQTNCISYGSAGLAKQIFDKFPYANSYITREKPTVPGTIEVCGNGIDRRFVINLYGQYAPGKINEHSLRDQRDMRTMYFHFALDKIFKIKDIKSLAFPYGIGCGLAGGDWNFYYDEIKELHYKLNKINKDIVVSIYKL